MSTPANHMLTIQYMDADGQVQRTEQLQGAGFTLRVHADALQISPSVHASSSAPSGEVLDTNTLPAQGWRGLSALAWALIFLAVYALLTAVNLWIDYSPDESTGSQSYILLALGSVGAIGLWAAFWALLGKIFSKDSRYWQHVCIVLLVAIAFTLLLALMHFLSFSLSWRALGQMDRLAGIAALGLLLWAHLHQILPAQRSSKLRWGMLSLTMVGIGLLMWTNERRQDTVLDTLHSPHLYRNALQLSSALSSDEFFKSASQLESDLKAKASQFEPGEDSIDSEQE